MLKSVQTFRDLLRARRGRLDVHEHPRVIFVCGEYMVEAIVRYWLLHAIRRVKRLIKNFYGLTLPGQGLFPVEQSLTVVRKFSVNSRAEARECNLQMRLVCEEVKHVGVGLDLFIHCGSGLDLVVSP